MSYPSFSFSRAHVEADAREVARQKLAYDLIEQTESARGQWYDGIYYGQWSRSSRSQPRTYFVRDSQLGKQHEQNYLDKLQARNALADALRRRDERA